MNHAVSDGQPSAETRLSRCGGVPMSLFGGAILATVATASLAQVNYFPTAQALSMTAVASGYVVLGAKVAGDLAGGTFMPGQTCSGGDGGLVFPDGASLSGGMHHCFYRADPTFSVREWGALCDVAVVNPPTGAAMWNPGSAGSTMGTLTVQTAGGTQSNYNPGNLISFAGGTFSQQAAIIVAAVDSFGSIAQWHFPWGGTRDNHDLILRTTTHSGLDALEQMAS